MRERRLGALSRNRRNTKHIISTRFEARRAVKHRSSSEDGNTPDIFACAPTPRPIRKAVANNILITPAPTAIFGALTIIFTRKDKSVSVNP